MTARRTSTQAERSPESRRKLYLPGVLFHIRVVISGLAGTALLVLATKPLLVGLGFFAAALSLYLIWSGWVMYAVDREGITVRGITGTQRWRWRDLGGVAGKQRVEHPHIGLDVSTDRVVPAFRSGSSYTRLDVLDLRGQLAFRVSPWTWRREDLAKQIRRHIRAARSD